MDLRYMVAVSQTIRVVINPCRKCRHVMLDLCEAVQVVVRNFEGELSVGEVKVSMPSPTPDRTDGNIALSVVMAHES